MQETRPVPLQNVLLLGKASNRLSHSLLVDFCAQGQEIHILDCAIRFRAYDIAEATKGYNFPILHRINIQRAFTPYQLLDFINNILDESDNDIVLSRLYIFLAPSKQFFDGDVKDDERKHLLMKLAEKFGTMKSLGFRFLISESIKKSDPIYQTYLMNLSQSIGTLPKEIELLETSNGQDSNSLFPRD